MRWNEIQGNSNTFKENAFLVSPSLRTLTNNKKKAVSQSKEIQLSQIKLSLILAGFSEEKNWTEFSPTDKTAYLDAHISELYGESVNHAMIVSATASKEAEERKGWLSPHTGCWMAPGRSLWRQGGKRLGHLQTDAAALDERVQWLSS